MKKLLLLPLASLILTACGNSTPAPVEDAGGLLSPGIMQSVDNPGNVTWQPQIQPSDMPTDMNSPVINQGMNNQTINTQPQVTTKTVCTPIKSSPVGAQNVEIPRNATTNAPDYSKIDKGFYKGSSYKVKKGDTMFLIAYIAGIDVQELAALNGMKEPYKLSIGQVLKTSNGASSENRQECKEVPISAQPSVTYTHAPNGTQYGSDGTVTGPIKAKAGSVDNLPVSSTNQTPVIAGVGASTNIPSKPVRSTVSNINWQWPTIGKITQGFSNIDGGNKGIDIAGSKGQPVYAAAAGRVVYAGNALRGYGNLIIIKHNDDYLSAYAHNDSLLVKDQQQVSAGQQIAKMGNSGTNSVKLHFEIRYRGKSVDPVGYLPNR